MGAPQCLFCGKAATRGGTVAVEAAAWTGVTGLACSCPSSPVAHIACKKKAFKLKQQHNAQQAQALQENRSTRSTAAQIQQLAPKSYAARQDPLAQLQKEAAAAGAAPGESQRSRGWRCEPRRVAAVRSGACVHSGAESRRLLGPVHFIP